MDLGSTVGGTVGGSADDYFLFLASAGLWRSTSTFQFLVVEDQVSGLHGFSSGQRFKQPSPSMIRISEWIVEQIVDPVSGGGLPGSSCVDESTDEPGEGVFRTFPRWKKVRVPPRVRVRECLRTRAHGRRRLMRRPVVLMCGLSSTTTSRARPTAGTDVLVLSSWLPPEGIKVVWVGMRVEVEKAAKEKVKEEEELQQQAADATERARLILEQAGKRRKRKKRRRRRLPRTSSRPSRAATTATPVYVCVLADFWNDFFVVVSRVRWGVGLLVPVFLLAAVARARLVFAGFTLRGCFPSLSSGPDARLHGLVWTRRVFSRSSTIPSRRRGRFPRSCRTTEFPQWRVWIRWSMSLFAGRADSSLLSVSRQSRFHSAVRRIRAWDKVESYLFLVVGLLTLSGLGAVLSLLTRFSVSGENQVVVQQHVGAAQWTSSQVSARRSLYTPCRQRRQQGCDVPETPKQQGQGGEAR